LQAKKNDDEQLHYSLSFWCCLVGTRKKKDDEELNSCVARGHCGVVLHEQKNDDKHGVGASGSC
jgi:hypothetical protein